MTIPDEAVQAMPERIYAKTHGASTDVISGQRGLIGGWNEHKRDGQTEFVRADLAAPFLQGVKEKALEWHNVDAVCAWCYAKTPIGEYSITWSFHESGQKLHYPDGTTKQFDGVGYGDREAAKAAAQADYEARILSAIEPAPSPRAQALEEAAKVAEQFRNKDWIAHDMRTGVFPTQSEPGVAIAAAIRAISSRPLATTEIIGEGATVWLLVDENKDGSQEITVTEAIGLSDVPDGEYLFVRDGTRSQAEAIIAAKVEQERLRFEGDLDKWMKIIGSGITGYQPEAYALMDFACEELVKLRADNAAKDQTISDLRSEVESLSAIVKSGIDDVAGATIDDLEADNAALTARVKHFEDAIKAKGGNEHSPTQDAYELACKAIEKHRGRSEALETQLAVARENTAEAIREGLKSVAEIREENASLNYKNKELEEKRLEDRFTIVDRIEQCDALKIKIEAAKDILLGTCFTYEELLSDTKVGEHYDRYVTACHFLGREAKP